MTLSTLPPYPLSYLDPHLRFRVQISLELCTWLNPFCCLSTSTEYFYSVLAPGSVGKGRIGNKCHSLSAWAFTRMTHKNSQIIRANAYLPLFSLNTCLWTCPSKFSHQGPCVFTYAFSFLGEKEEKATPSWPTGFLEIDSVITYSFDGDSGEIKFSNYLRKGTYTSNVRKLVDREFERWNWATPYLLKILDLRAYKRWVR